MIKLATWNVNSIRSRKDHVKEWILNENIDVLMLQELKCQDQDFPLDFFQDIGYKCEIFGQKAYNGVAILSRLPMEIIHKGLTNYDDENSRWIEVRIENIRVISSYFPNGNPIDDQKKYEYKQKYMENVYKYMQSLLLEDEYIILGGDYNVAPKEFDVYDPKAMENDAVCQLKSKKDFQALLNLGLYNTLDVVSPVRENIFSWWSYQSGGFNKNQGMLIDFLLCSPKLIDKLVTSHVDAGPRSWEKPSDHAPVVAIFHGENSLDLSIKSEPESANNMESVPPKSVPPADSLKSVSPKSENNTQGDLF